MSIGEINNVNVVADAGSIAGGVVYGIVRSGHLS